jgi:hypothetical protein
VCRIEEGTDNHNQKLSFAAIQELIKAVSTETSLPLPTDMKSCFFYTGFYLDKLELEYIVNVIRKKLEQIGSDVGNVVKQVDFSLSWGPKLFRIHVDDPDSFNYDGLGRQHINVVKYDTEISGPYCTEDDTLKAY